jgi:hypothetical protein
MTGSELMRVADGAVESSEGWVVRQIGPDLMEYCCGSAACLVNVGYSPEVRARQIFASESTSELFPRLREHLRSAAPLFEGRYVVV